MTKIGVTGQRVLSSLEHLFPQVNDTVGIILKRFAGQFFIHSPLATGAYRPITRRAVDMSRLSSPVPLPKEEYPTDFFTKSRLEFLESPASADKGIELLASPTRIEAFRTVGRYFLDHVDILLLRSGRASPQKGHGSVGQVVA